MSRRIERRRSRWRLACWPARAGIFSLLLVGAVVAGLPYAKSYLRSVPGKRPAILGTTLGTVESFLRQRSAIAIEEDFHAGFSGWRGEPGWDAGWGRDSTGAARPRQLALLRASLPLANYRLQVLGSIENQSLGWVIRASDSRNYYAMKITIAQPGPLPRGALVRSTVVNGAATDRVEAPLPFDIRRNTLYRVETSVSQDRFVTSVDGRVVDTFFDPRHRAGGVGLWSGPGDDSRILRVRVVAQDDWLGRTSLYLFRYFADRQAEVPLAADRNE